MTYWKMPCRARLLLWATGIYWCVGAVGLYASENPANPVKSGELFTLPNLIALAGGLISAGTVWQQWQDARTKIADLAKEVRELRDEHLPETYLRQDLFEAHLRSLRGEGGGGGGRGGHPR